MIREAQLYQPLADARVRCTACARYCNIPEGKVGLCGVRQNLGGKLHLLVYGKVITGHIDPIEKKPVTHYMPGSKIFSIATTGCNWLCSYCFTPETSVFTNQGVQTLAELYHSGTRETSRGLSSKRVVSNVSVLTHRGRFRQVKQVFKHFYEGPILTVKPWYLPAVRCTPNHRILTTTDPERTPVKVQARFINAKNYLMIPKTHGHKRIETLDLSEFLESIELPMYRAIRSDRQLRLNRSVLESYLGANSVSKNLGLGRSLLSLKIGSVPRFYVGENSPSTIIEGRTVSRHADYLVKVLKRNSFSSGEALDWEDIRGFVIEQQDYYLVPVRSITSESHSGFVYNMEVDEDHTYVAGFYAVSNCQNFDISQRRKVEGTDMTPSEVATLAVSHGCQGLAYTYNQPTIFMEFAHDVGVEARRNGLINIFVSNGYDTPDTVGMMNDFLDCVTIDFKGNAETNFVRKYIGIANADPIFQTILEIRDKTKVHMEFTDLVIPEVGDNLEDARKLSRWLYDNLGPDHPIHFLRFHPDYKMMNLPHTPVKTLEEHCRVAREEGLRYVYVGNVPGHPWEHTYCPECNTVAIKRYGFDITGWNLDEQNRCANCSYQLPIVGGLSSSISEERFLPVIN